MDEDNDGRFPDDSPVEVRYPHTRQEEQADRCVEVRELATLGDGSPAPARATRGNDKTTGRNRRPISETTSRTPQVSATPGDTTDENLPASEVLIFRESFRGLVLAAAGWLYPFRP